MRPWDVVVLVTLLALGLPGVGRAEDKPKVRVRFTLTEYRVDFSADEIRWLEAEAAKVFAAKLGSRIGFILFESEGAGPLPSTIFTVTLDTRSPGGRGYLKEVGFHMGLADPAGRPVARGVHHYWPFRPQERYGEPLGSVDSLLREFELRLDSADYDALIREVLSSVAITRTGRFWKSPLGWVLPHKADELCVAPKTLLHVDSTVLDPGAGALDTPAIVKVQGAFRPGPSVPPDDPSRERLFTTPDPSATKPEDLTRLRDAAPGDVQVTAVYVVRYEPLDPCGPVAEPGRSRAGGGS